MGPRIWKLPGPILEKEKVGLATRCRGKPVLIPDRTAVIKRIFELFLAGAGKEAIARTLNGDKMPTFGNAAAWQKS